MFVSFQIEELRRDSYWQQPCSMDSEHNPSLEDPSLSSPLYSDENVPDKIARLLESEGFDVKKAPFRSDDEEIAKEASSEGRVILSFDRHFCNILLFPPAEHGGIVFIRIVPPVVETVNSALSELFDKVKPSEFKCKLFVLTPFRFRIFPRPR